MNTRELLKEAKKICIDNEQMFKSLGIKSFSDVVNETTRAEYANVLCEDYGLTGITADKISRSFPNIYIKVSDFAYIASMGSKYQRTISWSADGRQPKDEVMFILTFPTGPYAIGEEYPKELFMEMWNAFKSYGFKYVDDVNKNMYFELTNAAPIYLEHYNIVRKYWQKYREEADKRRAEKLRTELAEIEQRSHAAKTESET